MAESDRPSSSSGGRRRIPLQLTRSNDATCIFEIDDKELNSPVHVYDVDSEDENENDKSCEFRGRKGDIHSVDDGFKDAEDFDTDADEVLGTNENVTGPLFQELVSNSDCTRQFATSLPIQVPLWKSSSLNQDKIDTSLEQAGTDDESLRKIAESFRVLAWDVKDGTEMFGGLPPHRLK